MSRTRMRSLALPLAPRRRSGRRSSAESAWTSICEHGDADPAARSLHAAAQVATCLTLLPPVLMVTYQWPKGLLLDQQPHSRFRTMHV